MESGRTEINMEPLGSSQTKAAPEGWTECFQDLQSWCHPHHQDELHTPHVINHDEFDFGTDVYYVKNLDEPSLVDSEGDPWGNNDIFGTSQTLEEENNNNNTSILMKLPYNNKMYQVNNFIPSIKSPLKPSSENLLLSQGTLQQPLKIEMKDQPVFLDNPETSPFCCERLEPVKLEKTKDFKIPPKGFIEKERPKLQLNIPAATANKNNSEIISLTTPEVLQPVSEINKDFDLVTFLDSSNEDYTNLLVESCETVAKDHNYTGQWPPTPNQNDWQIKSEPMSPITEQAPKEIPAVIKTESGRTVKRPRKDSSSDFVLDSDYTDDSADWSPPTSSKKKGRQKKKQKERFKKEHSDAESVISLDKYRELRDRNNEASRRSRYNRKQRDFEMKTRAEQLEKQNLELKTRAHKMEKLVEELRAVIMQSVKQKNT